MTSETLKALSQIRLNHESIFSELISNHALTSSNSRKTLNQLNIGGINAAIESVPFVFVFTEISRLHYGESFLTPASLAMHFEDRHKLDFTIKLSTALLPSSTEYAVLGTDLLTFLSYSAKGLDVMATQMGTLREKLINLQKPQSANIVPADGKDLTVADLEFARRYYRQLLASFSESVHKIWEYFEKQTRLYIDCMETELWGPIRENLECGDAVHNIFTIETTTYTTNKSGIAALDDRLPRHLETKVVSGNRPVDITRDAQEVLEEIDIAKQRLNALSRQAGQLGAVNQRQI